MSVSIGWYEEGILRCDRNQCLCGTITLPALLWRYILFHGWSDSQSTSLFYSGVWTPWWQQRQSVNPPSGYEGL